MLLMAGCAPGKPEISPAPEAPPLKSAYELGLQHERRGEDERAFEAYRSYVEAHPRGEETRDALYRMAGIKYRDRDFEEALPLFERIYKDYLSHPKAPEAAYYMLSSCFRLERFERCREEGREWLRRHRGHDLEGEVLLLLGRVEERLGDPAGALSLWSRASASREISEELEREAGRLIRSASLEELEAMEAEAGPYLPLIRLRAARLHLEGHDLLEAREAAEALLETASEPDLILEGRRILVEIDEELMERKGRIGCLLPLSGPFAIYGEEILNGIQLAASQWDASIPGPEIELLIRDTKGSEEAAVSAVEELALERNVSALIGPLAGKAAGAAARKAQELGIPIITLTQRGGVPETGNMVFRNFLTPSAQMEALAETAVLDLGIRRFGILFPENHYGRHFMNLFWDKVEDLGGEITAVESYPTDKTDFAGEVKRMVGLYYPRPASVARMLEERRKLMGLEEPPGDEPEPIVDFEAVFIPDNTERVALLVPQFPFHRVLGMRFLGTSLWQSEDLIETSGDYIQGAVFPSAFFEGLDSSGVRDFALRYREAFQSQPGLLAAAGYDTMRVLRSALEGRSVLTREDLRRALAELEGLEGVTGRISFASDGELDKRPLMLTVKGRRFTPFTPPVELTAEPAGGR